MTGKNFVIGAEQLMQSAFAAYIENTADIMFVKDINLTYVASSKPFAKIAGKNSIDEIVGKSDFEIFVDQELARRYVEDDKKLLASNEHMLNYIEPLADDHGHARYCTTSKYILRDEKGVQIGLLGISRDITREYMMQQRYHQELRYLFELPEDTYAALFMDIDDWRIIRHRCHTVETNVIDICETMESFSKNAENSIIDPADEEARWFYQNLSQDTLLEICNAGKRHYSLEYQRKMPDESLVWVRADINFMIDPENGHLCAIWSLKNIDAEKTKTLRLVRAAEHDEMTGCLNHTFTTRYMQETLKRSSHERHALFAIDVDNFKALNDTFGHQTGDEFLIALAEVLQTCFRESDLIGRMGGDEFLIMMKNVPNALSVVEKAETLMRMGKGICSAYAAQNITLSVGIAMFPENGKNLEQLYANADSALYQAKKGGKDQFLFAQEKRVS